MTIHQNQLQFDQSIAPEPLVFWKMGHSWPLFLCFVFSNVQVVDKVLPTSGHPTSYLNPRISGVGSNRSTNWATTSVLKCNLLIQLIWLILCNIKRPASSWKCNNQLRNKPYKQRSWRSLSFYSRHWRLQHLGCCLSISHIQTLLSNLLLKSNN